MTFAQALMTSCASLVVFSGSLIGNQLATDPKLSTLPLALIIIGTATTSIPIAMMMKQFGRKLIFLCVCVFGVIMAIAITVSIISASFIAFCIFTFLIGGTMAAVQQFRFAAMESVSEELIPKAASQVLLGGIAAAFIGPEIAVRGKDLLSQEYAGSFPILGMLYVLAFLILSQYQNVGKQVTTSSNDQRSLGQIAKQPLFWVAVIGAMVGYSIMSFIMTATPISMHVMDGHSLDDTKWVIQSHIVSMFLPSLFTGWIIKQIGIIRMMLVGLVAYSMCLIIAFLGHEFMNYWISLILLGIGWNFLFIGGTTLLPRIYKTSERFKVQALNEFMVFGVQAIASISAGWVLFQLGWQSMLLITIPMIALQIGVIIYWTASNKQQT